MIIRIRIRIINLEIKSPRRRYFILLGIRDTKVRFHISLFSNDLPRDTDLDKGDKVGRYLYQKSTTVKRFIEEKNDMHEISFVILLTHPSKKYPITNRKIYRPSTSCDRRLLLAQDILGFPHQKSRRRRKTSTNSPNHQPRLRTLHACLGMATWISRRDSTSPQYRSKTCDTASYGIGGCVNVSIDKSGDLLYHWTCDLFLGL